MKILVIIPARGGSKGIPHKNIKPLAGKPLIHYTIDVARQIVANEDICVSTDDPEIIQCVEDYGVKVPFVRPSELATDTAGTYEVLLHALKYYEQQGKTYDVVILLQNTSPFRTPKQVKEALALYNSNLDMVVSVKECSAKGDGSIPRRQDAPKVYEYNGAIYVINPKSLKEMPLYKFTKRIKYVMDEKSSLDLDTMNDWHMAELQISKSSL